MGRTEKAAVKGVSSWRSFDNFCPIRCIYKEERVDQEGIEPSDAGANPSSTHQGSGPYEFWKRGGLPAPPLFFSYLWSQAAAASCSHSVACLTSRLISALIVRSS